MITCKESRIGKAPVAVPQGVQIQQDGLRFTVKGPKGELTKTFSPLVKFDTLEDGSYRLYRAEDTRQANVFHGLTRALLNNMVVGVSEGFKNSIRLVGVGYRAALNGNQLNLSLGFSHPVVLDIPEGIDVQVERLTTLHISGFDKEAVGQFTAVIRAKRPVEPYKGKGVQFVGEKIKLKAGKRR